MCESAAKRLQGHGPASQKDINEVLRCLRDREDRLRRINEIIFASGAPLGSDNYFEIRKLAVF